MARLKRGATAQPTLATVVESYLTALEIAERSPKTLILYRETLAGFVTATASPPLADITADTIRSYLAGLRSTHKASSVGTRFRIVRAFFRWCEREGRIQSVPTRTVQPPQLPQRERAGFSDNELVRMVAGCDPRTDKGARDRAFLLLLAGTGLRIAETQRLRRDDVVRAGVTEQHLHVIGKGDKERTVALEPLVRRALAEWLEYRTDDDPALWLGERGQLSIAGLTAIVTRRARLAGVSGAHPHRFRNTALINMGRAGMDPTTIARIAGHTNISQTLQYMAFNEQSRANSILLDKAPLSRIDWGSGRRKRSRGK